MLREISLVLVSAQTLVLFLLLFESRYSKKKTIMLALFTMIPVIIANLPLIIFVPVDKMGVLMLLTLTLPSLIVFWIMAKNRDGRFIFTFCLVDTISLEIIYITQIINQYTTPETDIVMFVLRLVAFPILEFFAYKKLRKMYLEVQRLTSKGWYTFAVIGFIIYILMTLSASYPTVVTERPEYLPALVLLFVLIPVIYLHIISTLRNQNRFYEIAEQNNLFQLQVKNMETRIDDLVSLDEKFRVERHNYRHKMKTIASLVDLKQYDELANLVADYNEAYKSTQPVRYSKNAVIDATLSAYVRTAESEKIKVSVVTAFPDVIPVNETELATVLANALENAINACRNLEEEKRFIDVKVLDSPRFMIQIANSFDGNVEFDGEGIPTNNEEGHGFGTRSIATFCKNHGAHYIFKADSGKFTLYLNF